MGVSLIFKIAAGRHSCIRVKSGVKAFRARRTGVYYEPCGIDFSSFLDSAVYSGIV